MSLPAADHLLWPRRRDVPDIWHENAEPRDLSNRS